jgi:hypothetical protein
MHKISEKKAVFVKERTYPPYASEESGRLRILTASAFAWVIRKAKVIATVITQ